MKSFEMCFKDLPRISGLRDPRNPSIGGVASLLAVSQCFMFFQAGLTIAITAFNVILGKIWAKPLTSTGLSSKVMEFKKAHSFKVSTY